MARLALFAAVIVAAGCQFLDTRGNVTILPDGDLYANRSLGLRVDAGAASEARIVVDGQIFARVPVGRPVTLDVSSLAEGTHQLEAEVSDTASPRRSGTRSLRVLRDLVATFDPAPGWMQAAGLHEILVRFNHEVSPGSLTVGGVPGWSLDPDRRTLHVPLPVPVERIVGFTLTVSAVDPVGNAFAATGTWYHKVMNVTFVGLANPTYARGTVSVTATATGDLPASMELMAGSLPLATLGAPPWTYAWDTTAVREGSYVVDVVAPGWVNLGNGGGITIVVDRTAPQLIGCRGGFSSLGDFSVRDWIVATFTTTPAVVAVAGAGPSPRVQTQGLSPGQVWVQAVKPPVPGGLTVDFTGSTDQAGNTVVPPATCSATFPVWRTPWAAAPPTAPTAAELLLAGWLDGLLGQVQAEEGILVLADAAGSLHAGHSVAPAAFAPIAVPALAGAASDLSGTPGGGMAFTETPASGPSSVRYVYYEGAVWHDVARLPVGGPPRNASHPSVAPTAAAVAWSEDVAAGGRAIGVWTYSSPVHPTLGAPGATSDYPSLQVSEAWGNPPVVAYLETAPGGVAQLQVREWDPMGGAWTALGGSLNANPAVPAETPRLLLTSPVLVAWVEGGQVQARTWDGAAWSAAAPLNADPGQVARSLAGNRSTLAWVETSASGSRVVARDWGPMTGWSAPLPDANAGLGGTVSAFSFTGARSMAAWVDGSGRVWIRARND